MNTILILLIQILFDIRVAYEARRSLFFTAAPAIAEAAGLFRGAFPIEQRRGSRPKRGWLSLLTITLLQFIINILIQMSLCLCDEYGSSCRTYYIRGCSCHIYKT